MADTQRKRPGTVLGAGILLIIFGVYALPSNLCSGVLILQPDLLDNMLAGLAPPVPPGQKQADPMEGPKQAAKEAPAYKAVGITTTALGLLLGILALVGGMAVLQMKPIGRRLGMTVAVAEILLSILGSIYSIVYVLPIISRVLDEQAPLRPPGMPDMSGFQKGMNYGSIIFGVVFQLVIWTIVILLLRSRSASNAFAGKFDEPTASTGPSRPRYEGYDDEDPALPPPLPKSPGDTGFTDRP